MLGSVRLEMTVWRELECVIQAIERIEKTEISQVWRVKPMDKFNSPSVRRLFFDPHSGSTRDDTQDEGNKQNSSAN